jgi:two-component system chemotaxis sensor kinase CheA
MDDMMSLYIDDTREYLAILDESIIAFEKQPENHAAISEMFRAYHTMKSSTAAMDFKRTADFIHHMEDLLHEMREGRIKAGAALIELLYESHDLLEKFLQNVLNTGNEGDLPYEPLLKKVGLFILDSRGAAVGEGFRKGAEPETGFILSESDIAGIQGKGSEGSPLYRITVEIADNCTFKAVRAWMAFEEISKVAAIVCSNPPVPDPEAFLNGSFCFNGTKLYILAVSDVPMADLFRELTGNSNETERILVEEIVPKMEAGMAFTGLPVLKGRTLNFRREPEDNVSSIVDRIIGGEEEPNPPERLGEILVKNGSINKEDIDEIIQLQKECYPDMRFGEIAVKENKADARDVIHALQVQETAKTEMKNQSYIRIPASKIDNLVDHLGELLITQSLHKQEISMLLNKDAGKVLNNIIRMERIAKEIQDITMSLRMVSLKQTFQKIYRIGRDTATNLGKEIIIDASGEETEIDRNIVDKLHDPLMHLIRNAISHGIEEADARAAAGKPAAGHITLSASNRRGNVYIEINDDGKGLSVERIYRKAMEKELIDPARKYSEEEILKLIYLPGFSTQEKVDNISGRGVGMNVVQTEIAKLGGKIDIANRPGQGCSFVLKIPVNLATINGTIVEISGSHYIIPTLNIKQILKPQDDQWVSIKGVTSTIVIRNEIVPVIPIGRILRSGSGCRDAGIVITVEHEQKLMALPVQAILGKQEVVVKQLGSDFSHLDFISGATILGDGKVSLILDVEALFKMTEEPGRVS